MKRPGFINYLIGVGIWQIFVISLYWTLWFVAPEVVQIFPPQSPEYPAYIVFQHAFLLADAWLVGTCIALIIGLWKMQDWWMFFGLLNAGGLFFLGSMDLLYDLQHSVFVPMTGEGAIELAIVLMVFGLTLINLTIFWRHRGMLFTASPRVKAQAGV